MRKLRFLIVDDFFANRLLISEILSELGHSYKEAENGKEAIELMRTSDFDVVLMDIEMPVMNGIEATKYIRTNPELKDKKTHIIAITAHNPDIFFADYHNVGFDQLVTKPYSIDKFKEVISEQKLIEN